MLSALIIGFRRSGSRVVGGASGGVGGGEDARPRRPGHHGDGGAGGDEEEAERRAEHHGETGDGE